LRLVRGLYERGFQAEDVRLFRLIDWLMELPPALEGRFLEDMSTYQEERRMPFITTPERVGIRKGMLLMIEGALRAKFGEEGVRLVPEIEALYDADKYLAVMQTIATATTLEEVRSACAKAAAPEEKPKKKRGGGKRGSS
jgi:hypothetical protein